MGNALDAAKFSASQGLTGVSDPTASLSAITEGIETISDWKTKRDEAKEKLNHFKPATVGQAGRIAGVNPADVSILLVHLEKKTFES